MDPISNEQLRPAFLTQTAMQFRPSAPRGEALSIVDVAHALANTARFGGHPRLFYSLAQHSVLVSAICNPEDRYEGLMHAAHRPFAFGDIMSPSRASLPESARLALETLEAGVRQAFRQAFGLKDTLPQSVITADDVAFATEAVSFWPHSQARWPAFEAEPLPEERRVRRYWTPEEAEKQFLAHFETSRPKSR